MLSLLHRLDRQLLSVAFLRYALVSAPCSQTGCRWPSREHFLTSAGTSPNRNSIARVLTLTVATITLCSLHPFQPNPSACMQCLPTCGLCFHHSDRHVFGCCLTFVLTYSSLANEEQNALQVLGFSPLLFYFLRVQKLQQQLTRLCSLPPSFQLQELQARYDDMA